MPEWSERGEAREVPGAAGAAGTASGVILGALGLVRTWAFLGGT